MEGSRGVFILKAGCLPLFGFYIASYFKKNRYRVDRNSVNAETLRLNAVRGNKILYYLVEKLLNRIPMSELFGWAVRVEVSLVVSENNKNGDHILCLSVDPLSNELNPVEEYFDPGPEITELMGEDKKCSEIFMLLSDKIRKSDYIVK